MEILEQRTKEVDDSLRLVIHAGGGYRIAMRGDRAICGESDSDWALEAKYAVAIDAPRGATVAIIGGGFCLLPHLLKGRGYTITVYEIEPALQRFCPPDVTFVAGDYTTTLASQFDVVVYDLGDTPAIDLTAHLTRGGQLLGVD